MHLGCDQIFIHLSKLYILYILWMPPKWGIPLFGQEIDSLSPKKFGIYILILRQAPAEPTHTHHYQYGKKGDTAHTCVDALVLVSLGGITVCKEKEFARAASHAGLRHRHAQHCAVRFASIGKICVHPPPNKKQGVRFITAQYFPVCIFTLLRPLKSLQCSFSPN